MMEKQKVAIITGVLGQTGSYLAELLLDKGYKVIGVRRRTSNPNYENVAGIINNKDFIFEVGDITDYTFVERIVFRARMGHYIEPDGAVEIYNLAAQSFVKSSFEQPYHTFDVNTTGVINFLNVLKDSPRDKIKMYQASTSEMFGKSFSERKIGYLSNINPATGLSGDGKELPPEEWSCKFEFPNEVDGGIIEKYQNENTPMLPQSPYGIAKLAAHHMCRLYRESYGVNVSCGILFNHESPRRGKEFVTRKITDYIGKLVSNYQRIVSEFDGLNTWNKIPPVKLKLGNLDACRDWGHAKDYAASQWLILQQDKPDDYVVCTGETHTVREFCDIAFDEAGFNYEDWVIVDPEFYRPAEVDYLCGDCSKAKKVLGWKPEYTFRGLVSEMVNADIRRYDGC